MFKKILTEIFELQHYNFRNGRDREPSVQIPSGAKNRIEISKTHRLVRCSFKTTVKINGLSYEYKDKGFLHSGQSSPVMSLKDGTSDDNSTLFRYHIDEYGHIFVAVFDRDKRLSQVFSKDEFNRTFLKQKQITVLTTITEEPTYDFGYRLRIGNKDMGELQSYVIAEEHCYRGKQPAITVKKNLSGNKIQFPYQLRFFYIGSNEIHLHVKDLQSGSKREPTELIIKTSKLEKGDSLSGSPLLCYAPNISEIGNAPVRVAIEIERLNNPLSTLVRM